MYEFNSDLYNAWKNGKDGQSFWGQGYTSAFQGLAHADGQATRQSENSSSGNSSYYSTSAPTYSAPSYSASASGHLRGSYRTESYEGSSGRGGAGFLGLIVAGFIIWAIAGSSSGTPNYSAQSPTQTPLYAVKYAAPYYPRLPTAANDDHGFVQPGERILITSRKNQNLCTVRFPDRRDAAQYFMYCSALVTRRV
jgi:hypothetical protein